MLPRTPQNRTVKSEWTKVQPRLLLHYIVEIRAKATQTGAFHPAVLKIFEGLSLNRALTDAAVSRPHRSRRQRVPPMSEADYEAAVAAFLRTKGVTRCPTVCVVPTQATVAEADRAAYRDYVAAREAARLEKLKTLQQILHLPPTPPM
jgi:hypothetical protein